MKNHDTSNLERFVKAQELDYDTALSEIKSGHKRSHWMWYVFPQIQGLGNSEMSRYYAIKDKEEARAYMEHPLLRARLLEISAALLQLKTNDISSVMVYPDDRKLRSSMTLFSLVSNEPVFQNVLDKFFSGERDKFTLEAFDSFTDGD
ncbi:DUF1810 domain-containing protein [Qiania dongpingensis]|uniref:DUF1810 domain-containing protein n=1 Tax=Qiania dongpingensis TaxID=2763669 RepID=A0A7G9G697_9FIRM|nr:DUF1810 domain-containing protein [Qiania dongpingensis]QNM06329.1 DUF1810 domain-containing protein [Qiania dongpingensis]